jgi:hypothetical protein
MQKTNPPENRHRENLEQALRILVRNPTPRFDDCDAIVCFELGASVENVV